MKKFILTITLLISISSLFSQAPQSFSYQAVARDNSGNVLSNKTISLKISILQTSATGTSIYSETHSATTNQFGLFNLEIGKGTLVGTDSFKLVNWANGLYFLKIEMDETGGSTYKIMGTTQMLSVPYALYAENSGSFDLNYPDGFKGAISVSQEISPTKTFIVPSGNNLYIMDGQLSNLKINSDTINEYYENHVIIIGENNIVSADDGYFSGFYINAKISPSIIDLRKGNYTIPSNKIFILKTVSNTGSFYVDNVNLNTRGSSKWPINPIIISSGKTISGNCVINGYLK